VRECSTPICHGTTPKLSKIGSEERADEPGKEYMLSIEVQFFHWRRKLSVSLVLFLIGPLGSFAEPAFDSILTTLKPLVLQCNFKDEGGIPVYEARLFGTATQAGPLHLRFRRLTAETITLDSDPIPEQTATPNENDKVKEVEVMAVTQGDSAQWVWRGVFSVEPRFDATKPALWIQIAEDHQQELQAYLGDSWLVAGGENVQRKPKTGTAAGFGVATGAGFLPAIVTYLPQPAEPASFPELAPHLAARFAAAQGRQNKRPQMVVTVSQPGGTAEAWENITAPQLAPLTGWNGEYSLGLGVRGVIWWVGESVTESAPPAQQLPSELAPELTGSPARLAKSRAANRAPFVQWQNQQRDHLVRAMGQMADRLAFGVGIPPGVDTRFTPLRGKLSFYVVQAQGVWRQPEHFAAMHFTTDAWSSWELFRAAQNDAVAEWRSKDLRKVKHTEKSVLVPDPPFEEEIGSRACVVPALPAADSSAFDVARWQWDREADLARYSALVARLSDAVRRMWAWPKNEAEANVATVEWLKDGRAKVTIPEAANLGATLPGEAPLEYLVGETGVWKTVTTWNVPQELPILEPGVASETVIAVRYAPGDKPGRLRSLFSSNKEPAGLLPAFASIRDVVTQPVP
jgi:hypothetical protein